jgi:His-Xaa-Ser system protein HxsD
MEFTIEDGFVRIKLNPKLYDFEAFYSTAYQFMEDSYIYFEGDPETEIIINISYKDEELNDSKGLLSLGKKFMNYMINFTFFKINANKRAILRELLYKKSFESIGME